jgi:hypothetical protein
MPDETPTGGVGIYTDIARLFGVWRNMLARCASPRSKDYVNYGGRGITVCREWMLSFDLFCEWGLDNGYRFGLQLDRINNDGPYEPDNCRWVDAETNGQNKRNNHHLTAFGETKTLARWSRDSRCSVSAHVLSSRVRDGWEAERAITAPSTRTAGKCINGHSRERFTVTRANGRRYCKRCQADRSTRHHREAKRAAAGQYD